MSAARAGAAHGAGRELAGSSGSPRANGQERIYWSAEDDDLDFNAVEPTQECVDDAFASWRREIGAAEEWFAGVPESDLGRELPDRRSP